MKTNAHLSCHRFFAIFAVIGLISSTGWAAPAPVLQAYVKPSDTETNDQFGYSVAISGSTMIIGAPNECSNATGVNGNQTNKNGFQSGAAYVFVRSGSNWTQQAYLKASNTGVGDHFGQSVAIYGDTIIVGAPSEASNASGVNGNQANDNATNSGAAYIFVRSGTNWNQQAYLKASNTGAEDRFGDSVAISGDIVIVGATVEASGSHEVNGDQNDNTVPYAGAAYAFARSGTNWSQQGYLKGPSNDEFGGSVSVSGNTAVVGNLDSPVACVFVRSGTNWTREAVFVGLDPFGDDSFGKSVAVSGDTVVVGAPEESSGMEESGAAYVFVRSGTNWIQQAFLKASNAREYDGFGNSVAIVGDTVVVGASGQGYHDDALGSGAAYVFVRHGVNWSEQAFLKICYCEASSYDAVGYSVAVYGDTVVAGAPREDSDATGMNGNQSSEQGFNSGASYVFVGLGLGPQLAITPEADGHYLIRFNADPGSTNRLQRAPTVTGPWANLATSNAPPSGIIEYRDTPPSAQAFYRTISP
jgi:hypothetical protein